jgi:hypothetical protein
MQLKMKIESVSNESQKRYDFTMIEDRDFPIDVSDPVTGNPVGDIISITNKRLTIDIPDDLDIDYDVSKPLFCNIVTEDFFPCRPMFISIFNKEDTIFSILDFYCNFPIEDVSWSKIIRAKLERSSCIDPGSPIGVNKSMDIYSFIGKGQPRVYRYI